MKKQVIERLSVLITASFGLIAALAWNEAIKTLFVKIFGLAGTIVAMFLYAIVVTIIAVWFTIKINSISAKIEKIDSKTSKSIINKK